MPRKLRPGWDSQLENMAWEHLQNIRKWHVNKKMSEQSLHLEAKTNSFFEDYKKNLEIRSV